MQKTVIIGKNGINTSDIHLNKTSSKSTFNIFLHAEYQYLDKKATKKRAKKYEYLIFFSFLCNSLNLKN